MTCSRAPRREVSRGRRRRRVRRPRSRGRARFAGGSLRRESPDRDNRRRVRSPRSPASSALRDAGTQARPRSPSSSTAAAFDRGRPFEVRADARTNSRAREDERARRGPCDERARRGPCDERARRGPSSPPESKIIRRLSAVNAEDASSADAPPANAKTEADGLGLTRTRDRSTAKAKAVQPRSLSPVSGLSASISRSEASVPAMTRTRPTAAARSPAGTTETVTPEWIRTRASPRTRLFARRRRLASFTPRGLRPRRSLRRR